MRKNELIKLLQALPGNPEIVIWNGLVHDCMPISKDLVKEELVRYEEQFFRNCLTAEKPNISSEELEKAVKQREYMQMNPCTKDLIIYEKRKKSRYALNPKTTGKVTWDRFGEIRY